MSSNTPGSIRETIEELIVDLAWAQWARLSPLVTSKALQAQTIIDPEALLLFSMVCRNREQRLLDVTAGWLTEGSRLVSTQRTRTFGSKLAQAHSRAVQDIASLAFGAGDHRWKPYGVKKLDDPLPLVRAKRVGPVRLDAPQALMLRLRAGFGMGTKADVLAAMLGTTEPMTLRTMAETVGYGSRPLRMAVDDMERAGFVERIDSTPASYRVAQSQWLELLNGGHHSVPRRDSYPPTWQPWGDVVVLCSQIIGWSNDCESQEVSDYVAASRSRDIIEKNLTPALVRAFALPQSSPSVRWELSLFEEFVTQLEHQVRTAA